MLESTYQARLIKKLRLRFPECLILKNDTDYIQGIPDLLILFYDRWAMLEVKASIDSPTQPNQHYYIQKAAGFSFGAFIYPENEEAVLDALQAAFGVSR